MFEGPAGEIVSGRDAASVLDVACGNLRFADYLRKRYPTCDFAYHAVDNCAPLVGDASAVAFHEVDIGGSLIADSFEDDLAVSPCDLVVCFGYLHHVPGKELRACLLRALVQKVRPGGCLVVSFWQFLNSPELAEKARVSHARGLEALASSGLDSALLEEGDYLLGWQDAQDAFRYCHSFTPEEICTLVQDAGLGDQVVDRFEADGRTGNLNGYLVLRP